MKPEQIDDAMVDRLLAERYAATEECVPPESVAAILTGEQDPDLLREASAHLAECAACREAVLIMQGTRQPRRMSKRLTRALPPVLGGLAVAAAASIVFAVLPSEPLDGSGLSRKGHDDTFAMAGQRGASRFTVSPGSHLEEGDVLGMFYSATEPGYLAVLSRDAAGEVELIFPATGTASAAVVAGENRPLTDGAVVAPGSGCEWLVAVFSEHPLPIAALRAAVTGAEPRSHCALHVDVKGARTVRVFPVVREEQPW